MVRVARFIVAALWVGWVVFITWVDRLARDLPRQPQPESGDVVTIHYKSFVVFGSELEAALIDWVPLAAWGALAVLSLIILGVGQWLNGLSARSSSV